MNQQMPKAIKVENMANILKIQFDHGEVKYLRTHVVSDLTDAFSLKTGERKRKNLLLNTQNLWFGTDVSIKDDGTVYLNSGDSYTAEELWLDSKDHITEL